MISRRPSRLPGALRGVLAAALVSTLASCASRTPPPAVTAPGPAAPLPTPVPAPAPPPRPAATAKPPAAPASAPPPARREEMTAPAPRPDRPGEIVRLVQNGTLADADRETLVFARQQPRADGESSLFEDAIILSRLRANLKALPQCEETVIASAKVSRARVSLRLNAGLSPAAAARIIDAALKTPGVSRVTAQLAGPS